MIGKYPDLGGMWQQTFGVCGGTSDYPVILNQELTPTVLIHILSRGAEIRAEG